MTAPTLPPSGHAAAQNELLAQLGLPPSASPEDLDDTHLAVSEYLAAAPASIRGWAHAQAAAIDEAYLKLTDPVGLQGSALRSPTRPPTVVPGGPATPPARRDPVPAFDELEDDELEDDELEDDELEDEQAEEAPDAEVDIDDDSDDELDALYASVTPSAHRDMVGDGTRKARRARRQADRRRAEAVAASAGTGLPWTKLALGAVGVAAAFAILLAGYSLGGGGANGGGGAGPTAQASAPAIDEARVSELMSAYQANPNDSATLLALADEFYRGEEFDIAGQWLDKLLAIEPDNIDGLLARGAVSFNLNDLAAAETTWKRVVTLDPNNQEAHYDLGFLYFYEPSPDWAAVEREWGIVIALDPTTQLAKTAQTHLDQLAARSMLPASPAPSGAPSAAPSAAAGADAAPSASPAPDGSVQP